MNFLASWKTAVSGLVLIAIAGLKVYGIDVPGVTDGPGALIAAGIGLILAKDGNVTGVK